MFNEINAINAMMELPVIAVMVAVLSACLLKRRRELHENVLLGIISSDIALLVCDFFLWLSLGDPNELLRSKALWGTEYLLAYILILLFHYFLLAQIAQKTKVSKFLYFIAIPLAVIVSVLYFSSYLNGYFFTFNAEGDFGYGELAWVCQLIRLSLLFLDIVITLVFCRELGYKNTALLLVFETVPMLTLALDFFYGSGFIYIVVSILILIDYIAVSVEQNIVVAKQKQQMAEQEKRLTEEQTKIMISQIQPHFLYNVISSIMSFCKEEPQKAVDALADFSEYLRTNMRSLSLDKPVLFEKELEHVETYIRLEKFRFSNRLQMKYDLGTKDFFLPALTLQPLIENAVKHGIGQRPEGGTILLKTELSGDGIIITVSDDGVGFNTEELPENGVYENAEHIGIANVRSRVASMCGGTLKVESIPGTGTVATVFLPLDKQY